MVSLAVGEFKPLCLPVCCYAVCGAVSGQGCEPPGLLWAGRHRSNKRWLPPTMMRS